ncbi:MAG: hypothetical protein ACSHWY_02300, partial [Octadecabacter sp.]
MFWDLPLCLGLLTMKAGLCFGTTNRKKYRPPLVSKCQTFPAVVASVCNNETAMGPWAQEVYSISMGWYGAAGENRTLDLSLTKGV